MLVRVTPIVNGVCDRYTAGRAARPACASMNDYFKMFLIALVTAVASQLLLTPYIMRLQGYERAPATAPPTTVSAAPAPAQPEKLSAPNLEGMTVTEARDRWRDKGLVIIEDGERNVADADPETIVQQRPAAGAELTSTREIRVIVAQASKDQAMPDVIGQPEAKARATLIAAGFEVADARREASDKTKGTILKQVPNAGAQAKHGSVVRLTVAEPAAIKVPKVKGMMLSQAKKALVAEGLTIGRVRRVEDPERGQNRVLRQTPAPGDQVPPGTEVELIVVAPN